MQPFLKKCFEGINRVTFAEDLHITHMISVEKEEVPFSNPPDPNGKGVEQWMLEVRSACETESTVACGVPNMGLAGPVEPTGSYVVITQWLPMMSAIVDQTWTFQLKVELVSD